MKKKLIEKYMKENYPTFERIGIVWENTYQCWFDSTYIDLDFEMTDGVLTLVDGLRTIDVIGDEVDFEEESMVYNLLTELDLVDVVRVNYNI